MLRRYAVYTYKYFQVLKSKKSAHIRKHQHRDRNVIERFFAKLEQFRCVATRYDKLAPRFASFGALAAFVIWLK